MKQATALFDELYDISTYMKRSYFEEEIEPQMADELCLICASSAYAFDFLFAKEKAGEEITESAKGEYGGQSFPMSELPRIAKAILSDVNGGEYFKGKSAFRDYINYLHENDESIESLCKDDLGILILAISDRIADCLIRGANEDRIMEYCEIVYLNISNIIFNAAKTLFGPAVSKRSSYSYLLELQNRFEQGRYENSI